MSKEYGILISTEPTWQDRAMDLIHQLKAECDRLQEIVDAQDKIIHLQKSQMELAKDLVNALNVRMPLSGRF